VRASLPLARSHLGSVVVVVVVVVVVAVVGFFILRPWDAGALGPHLPLDLLDLFCVLA